jgi:hypothetical protein
MDPVLSFNYLANGEGSITEMKSILPWEEFGEDGVKFRKKDLRMHLPCASEFLLHVSLF